MTILTEHEQLTAKVLIDKGYGYGEVAHKLLQARSTGMQRLMAEEVAAIFGRKLLP